LQSFARPFYHEQAKKSTESTFGNKLYLSAAILSGDFRYHIKNYKNKGKMDQIKIL